MAKEMIVKMHTDYAKIKGCEYIRDLIRCEDCKYFIPVNNAPSECASTGLDVMADDYCSYAEER
jgi:hypothetical protein